VKDDLSVRPMFRRLLANQEVEEGENARFDIRVTGFPKPVVEWLVHLVLLLISNPALLLRF